MALSSSSPAVAQTDPVAGIDVTVDGTRVPGLGLKDVYPGATLESVLFLDGPATSVVRGIAVTLDEVQDFENGCSRPEIRAGDTTCGDGPDQGELSGWLQVGYTAGIEIATPAGRTCRLKDEALTVGGLMSDLGASTAPTIVPAPGEDSAADTWCLVVSFHHEVRGASDNLTQGDSVRFDLRLDLTGDLPAEVGSEVDERPSAGTEDRPVQVGGTAEDRAPRDVVVSQQGSARLATTGLSVLELLAAGWLLLTGGILLTYVRRRRTAGPEVAR